MTVVPVPLKARRVVVGVAAVAGVLLVRAAARAVEVQVVLVQRNVVAVLLLDVQVVRNW